MRHPDPGTIAGTASPDGVLFLHGIARRSASLARMERAFQAQGYATLNLDYPARTAALADLAALVAPAMAAFAARVSHVHVVTHSMGGLVARALLTRQRPDNLGRVVMLAPPNGGSEVADRLHGMAAYRRFFGPAGAELTTRRDASLAALLGTVDYPLGVIAGDRTLYPVESWLMLPRPNDGRVSVQRTRVAGMSAHVTLHTSHGLMMWNTRVIREALHFVRNGRFLGPDARTPEECP